MSILGISINASAQVSISTRADSIKAINDRQITTSVPPNLVYPVQVGSKTDSLCALIISLRDSMAAIGATTNGLQEVLTNSNVASSDIILRGGLYRTVLGSTNKIILGSLGGLGYGLFINSGAGTSSLYSASTGSSSVCLPDEGTGINLQSSLVTHYTKYKVTVDLPNTGDSTNIGQGFIATYAPPVTTYNMFGQMTAFGLTFGERNTAHTHQDGLFVGFTADGNNYTQTWQNDTGAIALVHNITDAVSELTPTVTATQNAYGNTDNTITSNPDYFYDPSGSFGIGFSGNGKMSIDASNILFGDLSGVDNSAQLTIKYSAGGMLKFSNASTTTLIVDPVDHIFGFGDGVNGTSPAHNGTKCSIDDNAGVMSITNGFALTGIRTSTGSTTMINGSAGLYCDPSIIAVTATINLPPSPTDGQEITIYFGGTITSGTVVTTLTINPGANRMLATMPVSATTNTVIRLKYRLSNTSWYPN